MAWFSWWKSEKYICDCRMTYFPNRRAMDNHDCKGEDPWQTFMEEPNEEKRKNLRARWLKSEQDYDRDYS